ncbi:MAG: PEP-CTERM sorting domain-containing protein [Gemmatimonadaceae bacterium]|nr:PEP-CTERM sorting domain-containing protein [Gemmatimonadaceae bacterium]
MSTMTRILRGALASAVLVGVLPAGAQAQRTVYPGGPWISDVRGSGGSAAITGNNPRNGNGSLELAVSGDLRDWGWFNLFSGDPATTQGWGQLSQLTQVGFDWYRVAMGPTGDAPWQAQSPALRLYVRSGPIGAPVYSELVWERWYTLAQPAPTNQWISENATNQMFWRFVTGQGYTIDDCSSPATITPGIPVKTTSPSAWGNGNNCYALGDAVVYGIGVGLGSNWPHAYKAFADNVTLGFNNDPVLAVHDNFELQSSTTPEPATMLLLGSGLAGIGGAMARRRRKGV